MSSFSDLAVPTELIQALAGQDISAPTDIQIQAAPVLSSNQDAWLSSPTGSGKTFAYLLPLLPRIDMESTDLQLVILAPTQELAVQIHECLRSLYPNHPAEAPRSQLLIGGANLQRQKEKLKKKPHIVIGSCGRMLELAQEKKLKLHKCRHVIIDEADKMMGPDSIERLEKLIDLTDNDRQMIFASATEKGDAYTRAMSMGVDVQWLQGQDSRADPIIDHYFIESPHHHKSDALRRLLHAVKPEKAIVFLHRNETAELVQLKLETKDLNMVLIHGERNKFEREKALRHFRQGKAKILVSSDVSARGLDIKGVTHIINLDAPSDSGDYLHRVGRTGRMGASGVAISIMAPNEKMLISRYENDLGIEIQGAELKEGQFLIQSDR
jgi:superfamily II DNA/RNA helicase